ncbi:MAG: hypothetical protein ACRDZ6_02980 [Acidimicrobiales bacterium]
MGARRWYATLGAVMAGAVMTVALVPSAPAAATPRRSSAPSAATARVTLEATSKDPVVTGDVWVQFHGVAYASATLSGLADGVPSSSRAKLFSQSFPFASPPAASRSAALRLSAGSETYTFKVTPSLATRYFVEVAAPSSSKVLARSPTVTVYVTGGGKFVGRYQSCNSGNNRPVCHQSFAVKVFLPASVARFEFSKRLYTYFAINLKPVSAPPTPRILRLSNWKVTHSLLSPTTYEFHYSFSFQVGNDGYHWDWNSCWRDTETKDGIGLPGHHGCGNTQILTSAKYLG